MNFIKNVIVAALLGFTLSAALLHAAVKAETPGAEYARLV